MAEDTHRTTDEAAAYVRRSPQTLRNWRWKGVGPAYIKFGNRVLYRQAALEAWLDSHEVTPEGNGDGR